MTMKVADIIGLMDRLAPPHLAKTWDNSGLQVGDPTWPVKKVWVALDPLPDVVERACSVDVDLLITHHPLIMTPFRSLDLSRHPGSIINRAIASRLALFCAHTNFDNAKEGLNDIFCERIGLVDVTLLDVNEEDALEGIGRVGHLPSVLSLEHFAGQVKNSLGLQWLRYVGNPHMAINKAAVCTGSGGSLMDLFLATDADVYVTGDLKYHNARDAEAAGRALLDIGHFSSEHLMVEPLAQRLQALLDEIGVQVNIEACDFEKDPFVPV